MIIAGWQTLTTMADQRHYYCLLDDTEITVSAKVVQPWALVAALDAHAGAGKAFNLCHL